MRWYNIGIKLILFTWLNSTQCSYCAFARGTAEGGNSEILNISLSIIWRLTQHSNPRNTKKSLSSYYTIEEFTKKYLKPRLEHYVGPISI